MTAWGARLRAGVPFVMAAALLVGAAWLDASSPAAARDRRAEELLYYPSGFMVRRAALGYETAAADIAWLRAIQYYGEHRITDQQYGRIGHVMSVVGELDPRFRQAYVFGAFVLAQELKQPERGLDLLRQGMAANPEDWDLAFETGFLYYVCRHDDVAAAHYFTLASRLPGHPDYVERFAAFANQRAGNRETALLLWKRVLATGNKYMQDVARREIDRLEAQGDL
jgi:hypothetical protein